MVRFGMFLDFNSFIHYLVKLWLTTLNRILSVTYYLELHNAIIVYWLDISPSKSDDYTIWMDSIYLTLSKHTFNMFFGKSCDMVRKEKKRNLTNDMVDITLMYVYWAFQFKLINASTMYTPILKHPQHGLYWMYAWHKHELHFRK